MSEKFTRRQLLKLLALAAGSSLAVLTKKSLDTRAQIGSDEEEYLPITLNNSPSVTPSLTPGATPTETPLGMPSPTSTRTPTNTPSRMPSPTSTRTPTRTRTATVTGTTYTPTTPTPPTSNKVVHVHSPNASSWNGSSIDYWNYVDQAVVDNMTDQGMMLLTGSSSLLDAWNAILPNYQSGQSIAIKVSFNNTGACDQNSGEIDAVIEPVNAIIRGLKAIGVAEQDIWIFETGTHALPYRFVDGLDYDNVTLYDDGSCGHNLATFVSDDPNALVYFNTPAGGPTITPHRVTDVVVNANYLINVPIMKFHGMAGVSLAFKNHYGTMWVPSDFHVYSSLESPNYTSNYSPYIDIYNNPNIIGKTILTVSDSLFCAFGNQAAPRQWITFGNQTPKSLLFSLDPVAVDCIMVDLLAAERIQQGGGNIDPKTDDYLVLATNAGLGTFERGDPWAWPYGSGYSQIDYQRIDI